MVFKAVIFDLDGTLLNTLDDLADAMNSTLLRMGFPSHPVEAYKYFIGDGIHKLAERVLPAAELNSDNIEKCVTGMKEEYQATWDKKTEVFAEVPGLLNRLDGSGIKKSIFSNKPDRFTQLSVKKYLSAWEFYPVLGVKQDVPRKPDPFGAVRIARDLGIPPQEIIFLGDTHTDMETAVAAGMYPVGALWGYRSEEELYGSGAEKVIKSPLELDSVMKNKKDLLSDTRE